MKTGLILSLLLLASPVYAVQNHLLIVSGIGGIESYNQQFVRAAASLKQSALAAGIAGENIILLSARPVADEDPGHRLSEKATIAQVLREIDVRAAAEDRVFVVLIGHGNGRGDSAVFNLPGPDISADDLAAALDVLGDRTTIIINTASASGPFIKPLSRPNRVVITATSSSREYHAPLFGDYFVAAFGAPGADRDKDERISLLEAFDYARHEVEQNFASEKRLPTEHALLDDNGDGDGSLDPGEFNADGALAQRIYLQPPWSLESGASADLMAMLQRKQTIEQSIGELKQQRERMARGQYYVELESLLLDLALLSREIRAQGG